MKDAANTFDASHMEAPKDLANFLRRSLFSNRNFNSRNVVIQVIERRVFLEGSVISSSEKNEIEKFVRDFPFVESVSSYITCKKD